MRFSHSLTIRRDPASVFRWIEDPELARRWQPEVSGYEITRSTPGRVGTEFRETLRDGRGTVQMRGRVTGYVAGERMAFELSGRGVRVRVSYAVAVAPPGSLLRVDADARVGGWLSPLLAVLVRPKMARQLRAELDTLRRLCEAGAG